MSFTSAFWRRLDASPATRLDISEWRQLAKIVLVQVPGSVEDERTFSAMSYLKNRHRNRLKGAHLEAAARLFELPRSALGSFNFERALALFDAGAPKRGRYGFEHTDAELVKQARPNKRSKVTGQTGQ